MRHTLSIFRLFHDQLPPLVPEKVSEAIERNLKRFEAGELSSLEGLETLMIELGHQAWSWRRAFFDLLGAVEKRLGEHFLLPRLPTEMQKKFLAFKDFGLDWCDWSEGRMAEHFTPEERLVLARALVEAKRDLRDHARREAVGLGREQYQKRVEEYTRHLNEIKQHLVALKKLAEEEREHADLANSVRAFVRGVEQGWCGLAPERGLEEVRQAVDFFSGRRHDLDRLRGINLVKNLDFYQPDLI